MGCSPGPKAKYGLRRRSLAPRSTLRLAPPCPQPPKGSRAQRRRRDTPNPTFASLDQPRVPVAHHIARLLPHVLQRFTCVMAPGHGPLFHAAHTRYVKFSGFCLPPGEMHTLCVAAYSVGAFLKGLGLAQEARACLLTNGKHRGAAVTPIAHDRGHGREREQLQLPSARREPSGPSGSDGRCSRGACQR